MRSTGVPCFKVEFPFLDTETRMCLWQQLIPSEAPTEEDIDFELLGEQFEMSDGDIKDAVLRAAFTAAEQDSILTEKLL